jgi:hypothetical protein
MSRSAEITCASPVACRVDVLSTLLDTETIVAEFVDPTRPHVPLIRLWKFRLTENGLSIDELSHVMNCDECMQLLGLCRRCQTLDELEWRLNEDG